MNGSTENQTSGASDQDGGRDIVLTWTTSRRMLPLVQRIVEDIVSRRQQVARLAPEKRRLDRLRRTLAWPERARRYCLQEQISDLERELDEESAELEVLGVALFDADRGQVGFPTMVNNRRAFFSWRPGEEELRSWHFAGESLRRPVPISWMTTHDSRRAVKN
ncbi:MAG TPA: DUF2203 family protein [Gemmataceae bacterium]|nr:DUF2203 family protein [Gemmataceae bacterium]